jgi:hypothetical protein
MLCTDAGTDSRLDRLVAAAMLVADQLGDEECASLRWAELRSEDSKEALQLIEDHCIPVERIAAFRSLARHRGVDLEVVIRAAFRGDLVSIVRLPPVR